MTLTRIPLTWTVGHHPDEATAPDRLVPAQVPGAVQLDWARAEHWPPHWVADNFKAYAWMADRFWTYRAVIAPVAVSAEQRLVLVCGGVDYACVVKWNGTEIHRQVGMQVPFSLDLSARAGAGGTLELTVLPAPPGQAQPLDTKIAFPSGKPPVSYGWDFHPRLIPLGIWEETRLELRPRRHLVDAEIFATLAADNARAGLRVAFTASVAGQRVRWTVQDPAGKTVVEQTATIAGAAGELTATLDQPQLWWPNGEGAQALYRATVALVDEKNQVLDERPLRFGVRRVRLVVHEGGWQWPTGGGWTTCQADPPMTLEINGRVIFAKGSNWVPPDIFPGAITAETYRPLLTLARDARMNLLRCWGGGAPGKDSFFEICDEMGIMLWQEFTKACNRYEDSPEYLAVLDQDSRAMIRRLRGHPSLVIWCGGNELFNGWSRNTEQDLHMRLVARNCFDMDPHKPFLMTSPIKGVGHGNYCFESSWGGNTYEIYRKSSNTAYVEFGVPGTASASAIRRLIPDPAQQFPPRRGTVWQELGGFDSWAGEKDSFLMPMVIEKFRGASTTLEELVEKSQMLQAEGLLNAFEEMRRQAPRCSMALNWCFNEPSLRVANLSLVAWPHEPKPALAAVAAAFRPILSSARIDKIDWQAGQPFECELWLLNDSGTAAPAVRVVAELETSAGTVPLLGWDTPAGVARKNLRGPTARGILPAGATGLATLRLRVPGHADWDSSYRLIVR